MQRCFLVGSPQGRRAVGRRAHRDSRLTGKLELSRRPHRATRNQRLLPGSRSGPQVDTQRRRGPSSKELPERTSSHGRRSEAGSSVRTASFRDSARCVFTTDGADRGAIRDAEATSEKPPGAHLRRRGYGKDCAGSGEGASTGSRRIPDASHVLQPAAGGSPVGASWLTWEVFKADVTGRCFLGSKSAALGVAVTETRGEAGRPRLRDRA